MWVGVEEEVCERDVVVVVGCEGWCGVAVGLLLLLLPGM
jgi:hypothetical protein